MDNDIEISEHGLRQMLLKELKEEANIDTDEVEIESYLGLILSHRGNVILATKANLNISKFELEHKFQAADKVEMRDLIFVQSDNLIDYLNELGDYKISLAELLSKV